MCTTLATSVYAQMPLVKYYITSDTCNTWGCASQTPHKAHSRVGVHSSKLWPYTGKWAKSRGWVFFCEWALFHKTTVIALQWTYTKPWLLLAPLVLHWLTHTSNYNGDQRAKHREATVGMTVKWNVVLRMWIIFSSARGGLWLLPHGWICVNSLFVSRSVS